MKYQSTRGGANGYTASQAILQGLAPDGGLFVPDAFPTLPCAPEQMKGMRYTEIACHILQTFLDDYTQEEIRACVERAYDDKFDTEEIAPLVKKGDTWYLELFHGATIAFKDMALSLLPHLMVTAARKNHCSDEIVILTATSGDTGKAAMAGFANVPGTRIIVFYPKDGVSPFQERQMRTQKGENTFVIGIDGNFDDAQTGVKQMFADRELESRLAAKGLRFSSANSINIGRLVPQVAYYVAAYVRLLERGALTPGERLNVTVPTGNFGNILAAYYAKRMGLPLGTLVCASNENRVLYDFFSTGCYDRNRPFVVTSSPSMDILVSSNLERLLYEMCGRNAKETAAFMRDLAESGIYTVTPQMRAKAEDFAAFYADELRTAAKIRSVWEDSGYVIDPHTAVAAAAADDYRAGKDRTPMLVVSTASPYKFAGSVLRALGEDTAGLDDMQAADRLAAVSGTAVPGAVRQLRTEPLRHNRFCKKDAMRSVVCEILGVE